MRGPQSAGPGSQGFEGPRSGQPEQNPADHRVNIIALTRSGADIARRRIRSVNNWWIDLFKQNPDIDPETFQSELRCVYNRLLANQL